jgi:hypothetical protein
MQVLFAWFQLYNFSPYGRCYHASVELTAHPNKDASGSMRVGRGAPHLRRSWMRLSIEKHQYAQETEEEIACA